jgi:uncharacterized phage protein gp47/JayE
MYESVTQGEILQRMLAMVNVKFDKREGAIIFDALAPASVELQNAYIALDSVLNESFADTASREYLIRRCAERGITPKAASYATVKGQFTPATVDVLGKRFSHEDFNYIVTAKISDGLYYMQCETIGAAANDVTGQLIPIDYIDGLQTAHIVEVSIPGEDEEDTETLRARYFSSIQSESFGGNRIDYKTKILGIPGVGGVKLYSGAQWNGGGTVKAVIIDSDHDVPTEDLVDKVQTIIDPEINQGTGNGTAPIGHIVTVVGAYNTVVDIAVQLVFKSGYSWDNVQSSVDTAIKSYFAELNGDWQNTGEESGIVVRLSQIESRLLLVPGIIDIQQTLINGKAENLSIDKDSLVSVGDVTNE